MSKWQVSVSAFGYYIVEAEGEDAAVEEASRLLNEEEVWFEVDGVDWGGAEPAADWERLSI